MSYQKQAFIEYLHDEKGNGNPGAYCNGLDNIEKLLSVDIDAEYISDKCGGLYNWLQELRKTPEKIGKNEHSVRQYASQLNKYIEFRQWQNDKDDDKIVEPAVAEFVDNMIAWMPFYMELADKLLEYKNDRKLLLTLMKKVFDSIGLKYPFVEKKNPMDDVDPFSVFGCFNKGISNANRIKILRGLKDVFAVSAEVPTNFDGIPVLNNMMAFFFAFSDDVRRGPDDIDNLWDLFFVALKYADEQDEEIKNLFINAFDTAKNQYGVRWNITMGLYWIRPYSYINLDDRNRQYLSMGKAFPPVDDMIASKLKSVPSGKDYLEIITDCKNAMEHSEIRDFVELSYRAWIETSSKNNEQDVTYWPSLAEFSPGLTKDDWKNFLYEIEIKSHPAPMRMLRGLMEIGGEATCKKLASVYGGNPSGYVGCAVNLGKRVKKYFDLPPCMDGDQERFFPFPFFGRHVDGDDIGNYSYKIRPELFEALKEIDLSAFDPYKGGGDDVEDEDMSVTDVGLNTILYGPPGTGKTYYTVIYAVAIIEKKELSAVESEDYEAVLKRYNEYKAHGRIEFTTFHQSYSYEEFIEGIKPIVSDNGLICYSVEPGVFKRFCESVTAEEDLSNDNYVFIIDEINRGNISKIFGELITLIECPKRIGNEEGMKAILPYSQKLFGVPKNVYIIGTMNTADRSIATIDTALRRRFLFREMMPDTDVISELYVEEVSVKNMLEKINRRISVLYDREHTIGHAYFVPLKKDPTVEKLAEIFMDNIIPLLQEYFYDDYERIRLVLGDNQKTSMDEQFITVTENDYAELFGDADVGIDIGCSYEINKNAFYNINAYAHI